MYTDYDVFEDSNSVHAEIGNTDSAPATNLFITIYSSIKISNLTHLIYSTNDILIAKNGISLGQNETKVINSYSVKLYAPRLAHGRGSYINLQFTFSEPVDKTSKFFNLEVVSDQGSVSGTDRAHRPLFLKAIVFYQQFPGLVHLWIVFFVIWSVVIVHHYQMSRRGMRFDNVPLN